MPKENPVEENNVGENEDSGYDSNNPKHISERKAARGRKDKRLKDTLRALLSHAHGREFIWDLLGTCGIHRNPYNDIPTRAAFRMGEQNIGQQLEARIIKADAKMYIKMIEENSND